jgi:filamentous hemagglutinin family protein
VTLDGTANPDFRGPLDGPDYQIRAELGRRAGRNLFHSFERFDLRRGESATFRGPPALARIISRVTGGDPSNINGLISSTIDGADFFFLNPAGVVFGPTASLDVKGSFHVSTADELRFANGERLSARLGAASSFTVAPPEAFGFFGKELDARPEAFVFLRADPAPIRGVGSTLGVDPGKSFSLVGGDIEIKGPGASVVGERVNVTALSAPGEVRVADGSPTRGAGGKVTLRNGAVVNASEVAIVGGEVLIKGPPPAQRSVVGGSSGVEIFAEEVAIDGSVVGSVGAPITITADRLVLRNDSLVSSSLLSTNGGNITLSVGSARIVGGSEITTAVGGIGQSGDMMVTATKKLVLSGTGSELSVGVVQPRTGPLNTGTGGRLTIRGRPRVEVADGGAIDASSGDGPAGSIDLEVRQLLVSGGGAIRVLTQGAGQPGDLSIDAEDTVIVAGGIGFPEGGFLPSLLGAFGGSAGQIKITADRLEVSDGALVGVPSGEEGPPSSSGEITITVDTLAVTGDASITGTSLGAGQGGALTVNAGQGVQISDGGSITSSAAGGPGGRIEITAPDLVVSSQGSIRAESTGAGPAGAVMVTAGDRMLVEGGVIRTDSASAGGGEIRLLVGDVIVLRDGAVTTSVESGDDSTAGSILIDPKVLVIDGSRIQADAGEGSGGLVRIVADNILVPEGDFQALLDRKDISATGGDPTRAGTVVVNAPEVDLSGGLVVLEGALLDAASQLRERCGARRDIGASSFTGVGRGGLPPSPDGPLLNNYAAQEERVPGSAAERSAHGETPGAVVLALPCRRPA